MSERLSVALAIVQELSANELQQLRGVLDMRLHFLVCGDPREGFTGQPTASPYDLSGSPLKEYPGE